MCSGASPFIWGVHGPLTVFMSNQDPALGSNKWNHSSSFSQLQKLYLYPVDNMKTKCVYNEELMDACSSSASSFHGGLLTESLCCSDLMKLKRSWSWTLYLNSPPPPPHQLSLICSHHIKIPWTSPLISCFIPLPTGSFLFSWSSQGREDDGGDDVAAWDVLAGTTDLLQSSSSSLNGLNLKNTGK